MDLAEALPLGELAAAFAALPVFPLFDTAYFIISVLYLKYEPGECGPWPGEGARGSCGTAVPAQSPHCPAPAGSAARPSLSSAACHRRCHSPDTCV